MNWGVNSTALKGIWIILLLLFYYIGETKGGHNSKLESSVSELLFAYMHILAIEI